MGLDMYLKAERYLSNYNAEAKQIKDAINGVIDGPGFLPVNVIVAEAIYWRKANAIHSWFVENCQNGVDECQRTYVSREDLQTLMELCLEVIKTQNPVLMETKSGFFFGSTDYDEYYYSELERTADELKKILSEEYNMWEFYYQSRW